MKTEILIFLLSFALVQSASTEKKASEESQSKSDQPAPGPAILAIEIVNDKENTTDVRNNTKRTIESALGYGFQSHYYPTSQGKKYMIYPYSQQDIPPSHVKDNNKYLETSTLNIQKSVTYNLGPKIESNVQTKQLFTPTQSPIYTDTSSQNNYYPSILFSSIGQGGALGGLSSHIPQQVPAANTIPVIILRVYSNQLSDPNAIYPNLPQTHPYANNLNNINLQSIISNYLQQQMYSAQQMYKQPVYQSPNLVYSSPNPTYALYTAKAKYQQTQQPQIDYKTLEHQAASLPTHENYPSDSHTRVIYHGPKGHFQGISYSGATQNVDNQQVHQTYGVPETQQPETQYTQQTYSQPESYSQAQSYNQPQISNQDSQYVYTDSNGQNYIYVDPAQQQGQTYYEQNYQEQNYQDQNYQQETPQEYERQEYQQIYQKPQEDRRYLPTASSSSQTNADKVYNYHAESGKDRSKKSSGSPLTFESTKTETKRKS